MPALATVSSASPPSAFDTRLRRPANRPIRRSVPVNDDVAGQVADPCLHHPFVIDGEPSLVLLRKVAEGDAFAVVQCRQMFAPLLVACFIRVRLDQGSADPTRVTDRRTNDTP